PRLRWTNRRVEGGMQPSKTCAAVASALVVLTGSACGASNSTSSSGADDPGSGHTSSAADSATTSGSDDSRLSRAQRALSTAGDAVPHGKPYDLETEQYQGQPVWDIKVASGKKPEHEVYLSADGDTVVHKEHKDSRDDDAAKALKAQVTLAEALDTANKHSKGHPLDEAEIDSHQGTIVWTAKFTKSSGDREIIL